MVPVRSCRGHCDWDGRARGRSVERRLEGNKLFQPEGTCPTRDMRGGTSHKSGRAPGASADSRPAPGRPPPAFGLHPPRSANPGPSHHTTGFCLCPQRPQKPSHSHPSAPGPATDRRAEDREEPNDKTHPVKVLPFNLVPETSEGQIQAPGISQSKAGAHRVGASQAQEVEFSLPKPPGPSSHLARLCTANQTEGWSTPGWPRASGPQEASEAMLPKCSGVIESAFSKRERGHYQAADVPRAPWTHLLPKPHPLCAFSPITAKWLYLLPSKFFAWQGPVVADLNQQ